MVVYQPNILKHVLHHLTSTEDLPAVAETFTDNRTTHTSIMTEWTSHHTTGRGLRITILQKYSTAAGTDHYMDYRQGKQNDTIASHNSSLHRRSPSPHHMRVTYDDYQDHHYRPQQHSLDHQSGSCNVYPDRHSYRQGNFRFTTSPKRHEQMTTTDTRHPETGCSLVADMTDTSIAHINGLVEGTGMHIMIDTGSSISFNETTCMAIPLL